MTNREKFIEVMNRVFGAEMSKDNMRKTHCSPCGVFKGGACDNYTCAGCRAWWDKEYEGKREGDL